MSTIQYVYLAQVGHSGVNGDDPYTEDLGVYASVDAALRGLQRHIQNNMFEELEVDTDTEDEVLYEKQITTESELNDWCEKFDNILYPDTEEYYYTERFRRSYFYGERMSETWGWIITKMPLLY